jgi:hypothetical protein
MVSAAPDRLAETKVHWLAVKKTAFRLFFSSSLLLMYPSVHCTAVLAETHKSVSAHPNAS